MSYDYLDYQHETVNGIYGHVIAPLPGLTPKPVTSMSTSSLPAAPAYAPYTPSSGGGKIDWANVFDKAKQGFAWAKDMIAKYKPKQPTKTTTYNGSGINPNQTPPPPPPVPEKDNTLMYVGLGLAAIYLLKEK